MSAILKSLLLASAATVLACGASAQAPTPAPDVYRVKFDTSKGVFVVEVNKKWAPEGAERFYRLVEAKFFDDCRFFRVVRGFMVQFGINGDPKVMAKWRNLNMRDDPVKQSNQRGYITFAQTPEPNSRSTQVFINFKDNSFLDSQRFAPFGKVIEGMNVVDKLYDGYGEGAPSGNGPDQNQLQMQGNAYLNAKFPRLDYVKTATIEPMPAKK